MTIVVIAIAGLSSAGIGIGSYLLVRQTRLEDFHDRSRRDAELNHLTLLEADPPDQRRSRQLARRFERRSVDVTIIETKTVIFSSHADVRLDQVRDGIGEIADNSYTEAHIEIPTGSYLAIVTPRSDELRAYFLYSETGLLEGLATLRRILLRSWVVVLLLTGLVGHALARRTLRPVSQASDAALSLAEGLLDTRLPVEREDEFGAWALSFNQMAEALEAKITQLTEVNERERRFTSDVSHELRTPISALVTSASMLEEKLDELDPDAQWIAQRTISQVRRVRSLVEELLEISRLQAGRETVAREDVNLALLVTTAIANHGWSDEVAAQIEPVIVPTDKARVERIVVNLIANAIEHGGQGVRVRVRGDAATAYVEVIDEGKGIAPEHIDHVFERFFKAEPSRRGGSGLGLAIAAENARLLSGKIAVDSQPAGPTRFTLSIPATVIEP